MSARRSTIKLSFNSAAPNAEWSPGEPGEPFTVHFPQAIVLAPNKAYGVRVISANFEYSFPNVSSTNNQFVYEKTGVQYALTIPDGLYTFADLADDLADQMTGNGHGAHASPVLGLVGNPATGILAVQINNGYTGYRVRWDLCTIGVMMGFPTDTVLLPENVASPQVEWGGALADASAVVDTLVITSSLIRGSYRNGVPGTTLEVIPLAGVPINAYHVHYPQQQTHSPLVANIVSHVELKMFDNLGRPLVNRGIPWGVDIAIDEL
jgi:hypothetical protein